MAPTSPKVEKTDQDEEEKVEEVSQSLASDRLQGERSGEAAING
jgi:hypothetical protein